MQLPEGVVPRHPDQTLQRKGKDAATPGIWSLGRVYAHINLLRERGQYFDALHMSVLASDELTDERNRNVALRHRKAHGHAGMNSVIQVDRLVALALEFRD